MSAVAAAASLLRPRSTLKRRGPRRWRRRLLIAALAAAALLAAFHFWLRDSSLVAVNDVEVRGVPAGSPDAAALQTALEGAATKMTTLHVRTDLLERAVEPFPLVKSVSAEPDFPDRLLVRVVERRPAALIGEGEDAAVVAADGTLIGSPAAQKADLPQLPLEKAPRRARLAGPALDQARVLGTVPAALQPEVDSSAVGEAGVVVTLDSGVELIFGTPSRPAVKWRAAAAVLSDPALAALDYVDLTSPSRPAVGGAGHLLAPAP